MNHTKLSTWLLATVFALGIASAQAKPLPEFTHAKQQEWLNSQPLTRSDLKGKVVLVDVWTYECWNCYRSFPWLKQLESKLTQQPFTVIGVHSPEFSHEKKLENVKAKVAEFGIKHPVMIDNDFSYWKALNNRFWPAFYIVDKKGEIRGTFVGETHPGGSNATQIETLITKLLAE